MRQVERERVYILSTQSTSEPDVVNGIRESISAILDVDHDCKSRLLR
jgi:hypothetical protein